MAKQDPSTLPTLDDFLETSSTLLGKGDVIPDPTAEETAAATAKLEEDAKKTTAANAAAETAKLEKAEKAKQAALAEADKKKLIGTKPADVEYTPEQVTALVKKAEENPETVTDAERKYLIDNKLFQEDAPSTFWEDVEKIHGVHVDVDYGTEDPESPEGAAKRDQALMDYAVEQNLEFLKKTYPNEFRFIEHASNGGKVEDLLSVNTVDYKKVTLTKEDKDGQKSLLKSFYMNKGFDDKRADRMVDADEDSPEGLLAVAQDALKQLVTSQAAAEAAILEEAKLQKEIANQRNTAFKKTIKDLTDNGKLGGFEITDKKDKEAFYAYAVNNIYSDGNEGYQAVLPLNEKSLIPVLQQLFFGFKNGDLKDFVKKEAGTMKAKKLLKRVAQSPDSASGQEDAVQKAAAAKTKALPTFDIFKAD